MNSKKCYKCQVEKSMDDFANRTKSPDGKQLWCKPCMNTFNQTRAQQRLEMGPSVIRESKICKICLHEKPISQFYVKRHAADGRGSYCRPCWAKRVKTQPSYKRKKAR
jgi:hypothetical protein